MKTPECRCELKGYDLEKIDENGIRLKIKLVKCPLCEAAPELLDECKSALGVLKAARVGVGAGGSVERLKRVIKKAEAQS